MTTARMMFSIGAEPYPVGTPVRAGGSEVVIGTVIGHGTAEDGRPYAELELTPAALGVGFSSDVEEDDFG